MLNELFALHKSLERCKLSIPQQHPDIKSPGKTPGFIIGIDEKGLPASIEYRSKEEMEMLWTHRKGNHNSFPLVKLKNPIWDIPNDLPERESLKKIKKDKFCDRKELWIKACASKSLNEIDLKISNWTIEQFKKLGTVDAEYKALPVLLDRFPKTDQDVEAFLKELSRILLDREISENDWELVEKVLIGQWNSNANKYQADIPLFFDVADYEKFDCRIAHPDMGQYIGENLPQEVDSTFNQGICSLTHQADTLETDKFPNPKLPVLGLTYLFSMNRDIPCHMRYDKIGPEIFPVGKTVEQSLQDAIQFVTDSKREKKTWSSIPGQKNGQVDLLISYIEDLPTSDISLAMLFSEAPSTAASEGVYEATAAQVFSALDAKGNISQDSVIRIFVLSKIDPGRKQLVLNKDVTVAHIKRGYNLWNEGSKNHPPISILFPGAKKGEKGVLIQPTCPSPASVMRAMQFQWIRGGTEKSDVPGCRLSEIYSIFLDTDEKVIRHKSEYLLKLCIDRTAPLLIGIGGAKTIQSSEQWKYFSPDSRRTALTLISFISILLFKLGYRKEQYMKTESFYVGQLLALADILHREYCKDVRKGEVPPQLIGNSLFPVALQNPEKSLARLAERIPVYEGWAFTDTTDKSRLAKWILKNLGDVSNNLSNQKMNSQPNDAEKAQLLLGYLAGPEKEETNEITK